jgi:hypothetical protein
MTSPGDSGSGPDPSESPGAPPHDPEPVAPGTDGASADLPAAQLIPYLAANRGAFTDDALREAAAAAGYSTAAIDEAFERIAASSSGVSRVRVRARLIVLAAYGLTFIALSAGMSANGSGNAIPILAYSLVPFLLISFFLLRGRRTDAERAGLALAGLLAAPLVFLVIIGGLCLATGLPLHPVTF